MPSGPVVEQRRRHVRGQIAPEERVDLGMEGRDPLAPGEERPLGVLEQVGAGDADADGAGQQQQAERRGARVDARAQGCHRDVRHEIPEPGRDGQSRPQPQDEEGEDAEEHQGGRREPGELVRVADDRERRDCRQDVERGADRLLSIHRPGVRGQQVSDNVRDRQPAGEQPDECGLDAEQGGRERADEDPESSRSDRPRLDLVSGLDRRLALVGGLHVRVVEPQRDSIAIGRQLRLPGHGSTIRRISSAAAGTRATGMKGPIRTWIGPMAIVWYRIPDSNR